MIHKSILLAGTTVAGILLPSAAALAQQTSRPVYGPEMMWNGGWHGWFFGPLMMIIFIAIVVVVVVLLVKWLGASGHGALPHHPSAKTPLTILQERFARGEIDKEEFEERRRLLSE